MCEKASLIYHTFTQFVYISTVFQFVRVLGEKFIMTPLFDLIIAFNKGNYNKL